MYAVIATGGKQYKVTEGETLKVEKLIAEAGQSIDFEQVLIMADGDNVKIGKPYVEGAKVSAKVVSQGKGKKVEIIKLKRRKHHLKHQGHRQSFTEIQITDIKG